MKNLWEKFIKKQPSEASQIQRQTVEQQRFAEPTEVFESKVRKHISENKAYGELSPEEQGRVFTAIVDTGHVRSYDVTQSVIGETIGKVLDRKPVSSGASDPVVKKVENKEDTSSKAA